MIMGDSGTSDMYQVPQVLSLEIRVDRVEIMKLMGKDYDLEDTVIWLQILDLPCMEMLPYQRDRLQATSVESLDSLETLYPDISLLHQSAVKINKKSSTLAVGEPVVNRSDTAEPAAAKKPREKKKSVKNDPKMSKRKSTKSEDSKARKSLSKSVVPDLPKKEPDRPRSSSKTLSFKKDIQQDDRSASQIQSLKSKEEVQSQKNIRMLGRLLAGTKEELPEGIAFNSDCCVILPCSSASEMIYKMERMPLIMYLVKVKPCNKLIGKVCIRLDHCYQNAVIKAAKVQGAVVSHVLQDSFPIFDVDECNKCSTGWIQGSVKLVSFGQYGLTELKSSTGDLMTGRLREYKNNLKDSSKALQVLEVEKGKTAAKDALHRHIKAVHQNIKPYACSHCDYKAARKPDLQRHIKSVNQNIKPYARSHCDYSVVAKGVLQVHIKAVHLNIKPYACSVCDYKAARKRDLRGHIKTVHEVFRPYACSYCVYKTAANNAFHRHT